jgi:septal ring factor EnvC (AmiA/AmiB activator)
MNTDELPAQLEELFSRARAGLDQQITKARQIVDSLNVEKTGAADELTKLNDEIVKARADLDAVRADLGRTSDAAGWIVR